MTFSLRSILVVIAVVGVWLGAIMSNSLWCVELAAAATNLMFFLSLALAIWQRTPEQRAFWTGFCVLGLANLVLANYFGAYQQTSYRIASAFAAEQPQPMPNVSWTTAGPAGYVGGSGVVFAPQAVPWSGYGGSTYTPYTVLAAGMPVGPHYAIQAAVAPVLSLILACVGGWVTLWAARNKGATAAGSEPSAKTSTE
jgi:hypothetical protein